MLQIPAEVFSLSTDAVVLAKRGRVTYINRQAAAILGGDSIGKSLGALFGEVLANAQTSSFAVDVCIMGMHYTACVNRIEDLTVIFLHRARPTSEYVGDRFWNSIRDGLMSMEISLQLWREQVSATENTQLERSLASMTRSYYRMCRLVSNVSYVLDNDGLRSPPLPEHFDLSETCSELISSLEHLFPNLSYSLYAPDVLPVCCDKNMLMHAMLNLLSNALLHAKGCTRICLSLSETADSVIISVSDDGCGISADSMHTVFASYQQERGLAVSNAGFGLTVARRIAIAFGGTLLLESRVDHGTTVRMSFSKHLVPDLHSARTDYSSSLRHVLMGLSDVLGPEAYEEKYMD